MALGVAGLALLGFAFGCQARPQWVYDDEVAAAQEAGVDGGNTPDLDGGLDTGKVGGDASTTDLTVGGMVSGLLGTGLVIQNELADDLVIVASGPFTFSKHFVPGTPYQVTVKTQPTSPPQTCGVTNNAGTLTASTTSVQVLCTDKAFLVGGNVSGLTGTGLVLQNNLGNDKLIAASGPFTFTAPVASATNFSVTVKTQPTGQTCSVTGATGVIGAADVTSVAVTCAAASTIAFSENFDAVAAPALPAGWTVTTTQPGNGTQPWKTVAMTANTAPNDVFVTGADKPTEMVLDSPPFMITSGTAQLTFHHFPDLADYGGDGGLMEIKIGAGAFMDLVGAGGSFLSGTGYARAISSSSGSKIAGRFAWTGNYAGYITSTFALPPSAMGQTVQLRWRYATDSSVISNGWRIDSVVVSN